MVVEIGLRVVESNCRNCGQPVVLTKWGVRTEWLHDGDTLRRECAGAPVAEPVSLDGQPSEPTTTKDT